MTSNEIDAIMKNFPTMKSPELDEFTVKFYQIFRKELILMLLKLFHIIEGEEIFSNSFC
jgi:hypothetical protein